MSSALAAQTGAFDAPFNHRNWLPDQVPPNGTRYNHSMFSTQAEWDAARNDVAACAQPPTPPPGSARCIVVLPPPLAGRVLVWDGNEGANPDGSQAWFIVDPARPDSDPDKRGGRVRQCSSRDRAARP